MADSQSRGLNYSALPVFSGNTGGEVLRSTPPGELMAPRLSGIPLLVASPRASRRHFSAQPGVQSTDKSPRAMPKSQSMRAIPTHKAHTAQVPAIPTLRLRPKPAAAAVAPPSSSSSISGTNTSRSATQTISRSGSLHRIPRSTTRPQVTQGGAQNSPPQSAGQGSRTIASKSREETPKESRESLRARRGSARANTLSNSSAIAVPSYATATTAASAAKKSTRSASMKTINTTATTPQKAQPPQVTRRMPTSVSTRSFSLTKQQPSLTQSSTYGTKNHSNALSTSSTSSSALAPTSVTGVTTASNLPQYSAKPLAKSSAAAQENRSLRAQPKFQAQRGIQMEAKEAKRPIPMATIHQGTATTSTTNTNITGSAASAVPSAQLSVPSRGGHQHSNGSGVSLPMPRRQRTMPDSLPSSIPLSSSVPFNLSTKNTQSINNNRIRSDSSKPKLDLSRIPRSIHPPTMEPSSARSSKSSHRSFSEATQRFFGRIKSASSSRASVRTPPVIHTPPVLNPDKEDWEELTIEKEPSEEVRSQLASLSNGTCLAGISQKPDETLVSTCFAGTTLAKTCSSLTQAERIEILDYKNVYFSGKPGIAKNKSNYTDDNGNYRHVINDHIGYRYEIVSELGKGSFGKVFQCRDHKTGRLIAVKMTCNRPEMRRQARVEAQILQNLAKAGNSDKHHFLRYLGSFSFRDHFCITSEILGDNLYELLRRTKYKGLEINLVRYITRQLVEGLEFLDLQGVIHCDLKPENILISDEDNCQVKIIDFGSGCYETSRVYTYIQSRFYRAPEILLGVPYSTAIDMWSLGCIVPELILGKPLFPGEDETDQIACLCQTLGSPDQFMLKSCSRAKIFFDARGNPLNRRSPDGIVRGAPGSKRLESILPPTAADFCSKILQWSPHKRLSAGGALFHEFVLGV